MKKLLSALALVFFAFALSACGGNDPEPVEARATYQLDRLYFDGAEAGIAGTPYQGSQLTFIGEEVGGTVIIRVGETNVTAYINPSRSHPSFEQGYWHHHLYNGPTAAGSPRINFVDELPNLNIDVNPEATDNTQSSYQHGNLHYIVETGEFRLRFTVDGITHDLIFVRNEA